MNAVPSSGVDPRRGLNLDVVHENVMVNVDEDYQVCVWRLARKK